MNELSKTGIFAGVAAVLGLLVYLTETPLSTTSEEQALERVGQSLFPEFTDSLNVSDLKVVKYDESLGVHSEFEVAKDAQSGAWILPSHDSYPADANEQIGRASNALIGVKILQLASEKRDDQSLFGVVEPSAEKIQVGATGVGTLVRMSDSKGERLVDLVIGKKVSGSETQRYVRIPSNDQIYVAEIDPVNFPTDFKQWIDKDLLELSSTDIRQLDIRKYDIIIQGMRAGMSKEFEAVADFNTADGKWTPGRMVKYANNIESPRELSADEQLNATKLNGIKTALDSLQIADVARKPEGLAANLKADAKLLDDQASILSLQSKGFFVPQSETGNEILSSSGELLVSLKDGVQYLLRFGDTSSSLGKDTDDDKEPAAEGSENKDVSINRYLLVTARLDESQIPQVELQKIPETVEEMEQMDAAKKAAEQAAAAPTVPAADGEPAAPAAPGDAAPQTPETSAPSTELPSSDDTSPAVPQAPVESDTAPAEPAAAPETPAEGAAPTEGSGISKTGKTRLVAFQDDQPAATDAPAAQTTTDQPPAQAPAAPAADNSNATPAAQPAAEETAQEKQERLEATRERITKENQRKIDERNDRLETAKKRVQELNAKFAEWYYVISESQYEKLTVSLDDLVQNKNAANPPAIGQPNGNFLPNGIPGFGGN